MFTGPTVSEFFHSGKTSNSDTGKYGNSVSQVKGGEKSGMSQKEIHFQCPTLGQICRVICGKVAHSLKN